MPKLALEIVSQGRRNMVAQKESTAEDVLHRNQLSFDPVHTIKFIMTMDKCFDQEHAALSSKIKQ